MCSRRARIGPAAKPLYFQVRINISYKPIKSNFQFRDIKFLAYFFTHNLTHKWKYQDFEVHNL